MKYFAIRFSLVINFVIIALFLCIDLGVTPFKNWLIYTCGTMIFTFINYLVLTKAYTKDERNEIFLISNKD